MDKQALQDFIVGQLAETDMFLVNLTIGKDNKIVVEIDSDSSVDIDECVKLTRAVEGEFDRDKEDYELEIGSAGLTSPLVMPRQYRKYIGENVEVLTADGKKMKGELRSADEEGFVIAISKKVKPEGAKRPVMIEEEITFKYEEIKYTKYIIEF